MKNKLDYRINIANSYCDLIEYEKITPKITYFYYFHMTDFLFYLMLEVEKILEQSIPVFSNLKSSRKKRNVGDR